MCRWIFNTLTVDIMPIEGAFLGFNTIWFDHALASAVDRDIDGETIRVISATAFVATKLAAFRDRGEGDFYGSHDLEDIIAIIDGRERLGEEMIEAEESLRTYVAQEIGQFLSNSHFHESLPAHLPPDSGSQARLPSLVEKLKVLAKG